MQPLAIEYRCLLPPGETVSFHLALDSKNLDLLDRPRQDPPEWAALGFHQCPHCPLQTTQIPFCPAAAAISPLVDCCSDLVSHEQLVLEVVTPERTIRGSITAQKALGSLMGLLLAVSGCPRTAWFKPMARFHLPLANEHETLYRAVSMYLLGQYFRSRAGKDADLNLEGLYTIYTDLRIVNRQLANRLHRIVNQDSTLNALVILDILARQVPVGIEEELDSLRPLFRTYLD
ncbi:hypothetical protein C2E25_12805 [Geothermobacter hydrogeniphilus]|uniref:Uncharacterized protein n=1 Tax=Geothermobacter hydrogeniphilus TaxID=1969733 RepID=A0A2K2H800_9BACT|nr:hypothetical protein [Geothermobacter hydrogeniphilus]PNU19363.1 hypothetical protein C2E25_12805 [Geothermobacter hydrogeniphilus]